MLSFESLKHHSEGEEKHHLIHAIVLLIWFQSPAICYRLTGEDDCCWFKKSLKFKKKN